jgi:hypothetical protein
MQKTSLRLAFAIALLFGLRVSQAQAPDLNALNAMLAKEASGELVDRRLANVSQPQNDAAAWQAGMVKVGNDWLPMEQLDSKPGQVAADGYLEKRNDLLKEGPQGHLKLARWCVRHKLPEQARAHYFGVLVADTNHLEARQFLGHRLVGDQWVEQEDLQIAQQETHLTLRQLELWTPKLASIVRDLQSAHLTTKTKALQKLASLDAEEVLPALELFAAHIDDDLAKPLIRKITGIRSKAACQALVRVALSHPSAEVRRVSADAIRQYPESYFVPQLLSMLAKEIAIENRLIMQGNGSIGMVTVVENEQQHRKYEHQIQKLVNVVAEFSSQHSVSLSTSASADLSYWSNFWHVPQSAPETYGNMSQSLNSGQGNARLSLKYVPAEVVQSVALSLREQGQQQHRAAAQQNRALHENTNHICTLLRSTTDADFADNPEEWWSWWSDRYERYESKSTSYSYAHQRQQLKIAKYTYAPPVQAHANHDLGHATTQYSCLVPGTLIQTATGLVPIETIQIGDFVVSQNVETAELALKPVILTTVRPPKSILQIVTGSNKIDATGGHQWWISGLGWVKTRDLKPGMMLHTSTGTLEIDRLVEDSVPQVTHNLVVDGNHTYFVGTERVLSHDNTLAKPTLYKVPGYEHLALASPAP